MLFDLRGKRRRLIQVIYAMLAVLMGGGLVLFGIGSDVSGGLLEGIGIGGGSNPAGADYDKQAAKIEQRLAADPKNEELLLQLARTRILAGNSTSASDSATGEVSYPQESLQQFEKAADAWERYLEASKGKPSDKAAILVSQTYVALAQNERSILKAVDDIKGAAKAQQIYADANPSLGSLSQLAIYLYLSGDTAGGDQAADEALAKADSSNRSELEARLKQARKQAKLIKKQLKAAQKVQGSKDQLENPLGGLGGGGLGVPGGTSPGAQP